MEMERCGNENSMIQVYYVWWCEVELYNQAVGFEMLYQESKGRPNSQNVSAEGIKSSVSVLCIYLSP